MQSDELSGGGLFSQLFTFSFFNVFLLITCIISYFLIKYTISFFVIYNRFKHIPGYVSFFPPLLDGMIHKKIYLHHLYDCGLESFKKNPKAKVIKIQLGTFCQVQFSRDDNLIREILVKKYKTISKGKMFEPMGMFGPNIFSADSSDPIWRKHRTLANPIFSSSSHLKNVFRVSIEESKKMIAFWKKIYGTETDGTIRKVNICNELKSVTLNVINRVAFDYDVGIFDKDAKNRDGIHDWITDLLNGLMYNFMLPNYLFEYVPFGFFRRYKDAKEKFKQATYSMIEQKQRELDDHTYLEKEDEDLLTLLLKSSSAATSEEEKLSKLELLSAIFIIFFAGFETTSTSLTFMLRMLAKNQQIQEEIINEINKEISHIDELTFEIVTNKLPLLTSFIKEVLRTKTPIGTGPRIVLKKGGEVIDGIHYPKGTEVTVSYFCQHYFAKNGLDEFNPYRFLTPSTSSQSDNSDDFENSGKGPMGELNINLANDGLIPFSIGPRDCIGKRMALLEMKLIIIFLLKNYKLKVPEGLEAQQDSIKETYVATRTVFEPYLVDFEVRQ